MATRIDDDFMTAEYDGRVIATARCSSHAADDGQGAWVVSDWPGRLFTRNQAITAMVLVERLAAGYGEDDLFVIGWREELACDRPAHQDHHGARGGGRGHLVPARIRAGALARESGVTVGLVPFTVDGLIWAASLVVLDAGRRGQPVPPLAAWSLVLQP